jgi:hypothetical protein
VNWDAEKKPASLFCKVKRKSGKEDVTIYEAERKEQRKY